MKVLESLNGIVWGIPVLFLILAAGVFLSVRSRFAQIRYFPDAVRSFMGIFRKRKNNNEKTSGYRALCTALAATAGTGNIAGIAGAIALGGPGVVFWIWISGLLGMIIKFAEVILAIHYRIKDRDGNSIGGPMYIISKGLPEKYRFLSPGYCFLGILASFGVGNAAQINAVVDGLKSIGDFCGIPWNLPQLLISGVIISFVISLAFRKGSDGIGCWAEKLVPLAATIYIGLAAVLLILRVREIPTALRAIIAGAFQPRSFTGGVISSALCTLRIGISRGIFTNEAGMGTASIAHASAHTERPIQQSFMGMMEVFLDTIVLCTLTALVVLCSGISIPFGEDPGLKLTLSAFENVLGEWSSILITALVCIFAFATILGWGYYGIRFAECLFGPASWRGFAFAEATIAFMSVFANTSSIWIVSEILNGLMAIPNLLALLWLMPISLSYLKAYEKELSQN